MQPFSQSHFQAQALTFQQKCDNALEIEKGNSQAVLGRVAAAGRKMRSQKSCRKIYFFIQNLRNLESCLQPPPLWLNSQPTGLQFIPQSRARSRAVTASRELGHPPTGCPLRDISWVNFAVHSQFNCYSARSQELLATYFLFFLAASSAERSLL